MSWYPVENVHEVNKGFLKSYFREGCVTVYEREYNDKLVSVLQESSNLVSFVGGSKMIEDLPTFGLRQVVLMVDNEYCFTIVIKDDCDDKDAITNVNVIADWIMQRQKEDGKIGDLVYVYPKSLIDEGLYTAYAYHVFSTVNAAKGLVIPVMWVDLNQDESIQSCYLTDQEMAADAFSALESAYPALNKDDVDYETERFVEVSTYSHYLIFNRNHNAYNGKKTNAEMALPLVALEVAGASGFGWIVTGAVDFLVGFSEDYSISMPEGTEIKSGENTVTMAESGNKAVGDSGSGRALTRLNNRAADANRR